MLTHAASTTTQDNNVPPGTTSWVSAHLHACGARRCTLHVTGSAGVMGLPTAGTEGWSRGSNVNYFTAVHFFRQSTVFIAKLAAHFPAAWLVHNVSAWQTLSDQSLWLTDCNTNSVTCTHIVGRWRLQGSGCSQWAVLKASAGVLLELTSSRSGWAHTVALWVVAHLPSRLTHFNYGQLTGQPSTTGAQLTGACLKLFTALLGLFKFSTSDRDREFLCNLNSRESR